jgi:hypothetical protein
MCELQSGDGRPVLLAEIGRGQVKAVKIRTTTAMSRMREASAIMSMVKQDRRQRS